MTDVEDLNEQSRLAATYENLREKLLDLSKKNRMLNYSLGARSKRHLQIVDEVLEEIYRKLVSEEAVLRIEPLEEPEDIPPEEKTEEFIAAFEHAKVSNLEYLTRLQALESAGRDDEIELAKLDRNLRDQIRGEFGLHLRPKKAEINRADHARRLDIDPNVELGATKSKPSHSDTALQTLKFPDELERIMGNIAADAKLSEQEMGISTLFLAFGFLEWYDADSSDKKAFAPLLLLPVTIGARKIYGRNSYSLTAAEPAAESNLSLQKLLEKNFRRTLPTFDGGEEEKVGSVEAYLDEVRSAIKDLGRWQIHRWLVLGHFAFGRFAVYADLNPDNWDIDPSDHPLIRSILRGTDRNGDGNLISSEPDDYFIDDPGIEAIAPFLIQDADASQHSALIDAMKGHNLVIQGPPGTGKSQTIANIIANGVAANKTILFVAEKQAALEVVKRRLEKAGIGDFCLELHSDKASAKIALESLGRRLKVAPVAAPAVHDSSLHENRREIAGYLDALHDAGPSGRTPFDLIWKALRGSTLSSGGIEALKTTALPDQLLKDAARLSEAEARLAIYAAACQAFLQAFGHPLDSPWRAAGIGVVQSSQIDRVVECLSLIEQSARDVAGCISENADFDVGSVMDLQALVMVRKALGHRTAPDVTGTVAQLDAERLLDALTALKEMQATEASVAASSLNVIDDAQVLATAVEFGNRKIAAEYLEYTPAALFSVARETIGRNMLLHGALKGLEPALEYFDLDDSIPSNQLDAVAKAVIISAKIPPQYRYGLDLNQDINEDAFAALRGQWSGLLTREKDWRQRFSSFGNERWPAPSQLRAVADLLRKSGLSRAFTALSGSAKTARALIARLGVDGSVTSIEDLVDLAQHVDAIDEFEADSAAEALLGQRWDGLDTAFDQIAFGIKARRYLSEQIGGDLTQRLIKIPQHAVRGLHHFEAAAADCLRTTAKFSDRLDGQSMDAVLRILTDETAAMQSILDVDPNTTLVGYDVPAGKLAEFAKLRLHQDRVRKVFESSPLKQAAQELSSAANGIDDAVMALEWLSAVRSTDMPVSLARRLTSVAAKSEWERLRHSVDLVARPLESYAEQLAILTREFGMTELGRLGPKELCETAARLVAHRDQLREYLGVQRERLVLESMGLKDFLARADLERIDPTYLPSLLETIAAYRGAGLARGSAEPLHNNTGTTLEVRRKQFADKDRKKIREDRIRIKAKLLAKRPLPGSSFGKRKTWTEMALLNNEFEKQKRFVPVRTLLAQAGRSMQALKPCFMMSPLSLAKFMKPQSLKFDILVIDEASQMRPEDALGAMLRSSQIVVVGDQKQLPPTDFFARSSESSDNEEDEFEDLDDESILESCQKAFGQRRSLKWHYRSHCESLIRFSNEQFYGNGLITFPAAKPDSFAVDLISVDGVFQARCNPAEASRVAEEAVTFMRHHAAFGEDDIPSLGIVAINIQQRNLIQEELNRLIADDVLVDQYREKVLNKGEELFVKNLENVQGDERDFIFISMTYGPEANTSIVKQRFGPINRKQGHRRLNVLFSRARVRIGLFCSFGSIDVLPREDSSEGVRVLRRYLEFAETKGRVSITQAKNREPDSDFESEVADRLRAKGFTVDYQVGVSGYRIDLGVRHPDHPAQYLAGIECDGAAYHSSKSARDRDRLREEVLNDKGWEIVRVWSTDWFDNPALQTERMVQKLELLRERSPAKHDDYAFSLPPTSLILKSDGQDAGEGVHGVSEVSEPEISGSDDIPSTPPSSDEVSPLSEAQCFEALGRFRDEVIAIEAIDWEPHRSILREAMIETFVRQRFADAEEWFDKVPGYLRQGTNPAEKSKYLERICDVVGRMPCSAATSGAQKEGFFLDISGDASKPAQIKLPMGFANSQTGPISRLPTEPAYSATNFSVLTVKPDASRFYDREYGVVLRTMVDHVITTESPIYEDLLIVRIARAHGFQRAGERIQKTLSSVMAMKYRRTREDDRTVIWDGLRQADQLVPFRPSQPEVRSYADVPIPELASLAVPFLRLRLANEDVLYRMADQFQLGRLREATRSRFQAAVNFAKEKS